jgi:hypothetical protein
MQVRMAATANEAPLKEAVAADNLMAHLAQGFDSLRSGEDPAAPEWASLLARFADGSALSSLAGPTAVTQAQLEALKGQLGLDELRQQVEALQGTLKEYKTNVDGLRNFIVRGPGG